MEPTTTTVPLGPSLTSHFPSASEMIGWVFGRGWDWVNAHKLMTIAGLGVAIVWYLGIVIHRYVVEV